MKLQWKQVVRDQVKGQWAALYVTLNPKGQIVMSRVTYERMGAPDAFNVLFDPANNVIGLQPAARAARNAFPACRSGRHGGRQLNAFRLVTDNNIHLPHTVQFYDAEIDRDGILVLDLRTAKVSGRVTNHHRNRAERVSTRSG